MTMLPVNHLFNNCWQSGNRGRITHINQVAQIKRDACINPPVIAGPTGRPAPRVTSCVEGCLLMSCLTGCMLITGCGNMAFLDKERNG